ncbi:MAG: lysophospholipid acyltransferase family protein [Parvularculales bacterium]
MKFIFFGYRLRHWLEVAALFLYVGICLLLGLKIASALWGFVARTIGPYLGISRRIRRNVARAMPDISAEECAAIEKSVWDNAGRATAEIIHLKRLANNDKYFTITGTEHIQAAIDKGKGVVFMSGHFANWEMLPKAAQTFEIECNITYRQANNPLVDRWLTNQRHSAWGHTFSPKGQNAAKTMIRFLKVGKSVATLVDQKENQGIEAKFFDLPAMTTPAPAQLALRYGVPVILATITREPNPDNPESLFHIHSRPLQPPPATGNTQQDIALMTQSINDFLEAHIRKRPGEWLWLHNRWSDD